MAVVRGDVPAAREASARPGLGLDWLGWTASALAAVLFALVLGGWLTGGLAVSFPWAPTLDLRLSFALDGLGALYALLATGVGTLVFAYGTGYLTVHLEHEGRPAGERWRFWPWMALFAVAMVGLATAQDLVLLFVFFDLTAVCSYFLIGFDRGRREARTAALMALLVTVVSAVAMLVAAVLLYAEYGTFSIPELIARTGTGPVTTIAAALLAVAGVAKSAQVPLHFWLPRAMAAPTPVSAYLHSAAMVAAGVLVIARVHPLLERSAAVLTGLIVVGGLSILIGGVLALRQDVLKQVLAYSTISQYGYLVLMYGIGSAAGNGAAAFYVLAHGVAKSALFMAAGAVTEATGENRLSRLGGLRRSMPLLAAASALAAANLVSLPLTVGFFADEFFFAAVLERGTPFAVLAVISAAITLTYTWRFLGGIFGGGPGTAGARRVPRLLVAPVAALGVIGLIGGFVAGPFEGLAEAAGGVSFEAPTPLDASYHPELLPEYVMALAAYALGVVLILSRPVWSPVALGLSRLGKLAGPERLFGLTVHGLNVLSDVVHRAEIRNLRGRVASVLMPTAAMVGAGVLATGLGAYEVGPLRLRETPLMLVLLAVAAASIAATLTRRHVTLVLALSSVGFMLAVVYAFYGAPNVALVAVLIETVQTLLLVATLRLIPHRILRHQAELPVVRRNRKVLVAAATGAFGFVVAWGRSRSRRPGVASPKSWRGSRPRRTQRMS